MTLIKQFALVAISAVVILAMMIAGPSTIGNISFAEGLVPSLTLCIFGVVLVRLSIAGNKRQLAAADRAAHAGSPTRIR